MQDLEDLGDRPEEPQPGECCGSGCARCVWDVYYDNIAAYEARRAKGCVKRNRAATSTAIGPEGEAASSAIARPNHGGYIGGVVLKYEPDEYDGYERDGGAHWKQQLGGGRACLAARLHSSTSSSSLSEEELKDGDTTNCPLRLVQFEVEEEGGGGGGILMQKGKETPSFSDLPSSFRPSDVVELFVPNDETLVSEACRLFGVPPTRTAVLNVSGYVDPTHFPPWLPKRRILTMKELFSYYVDLTSSASIRRPLLELLHRSCPAGDEGAKDKLATLVESPAATLELLRASLPTVVDLLRALPAGGVPPLAKFLEVSAPLRPRKFSIVEWRPSAGGKSDVTLCVRQTLTKREAPTLWNTNIASWFRGHVTTALCRPPGASPPPCCWLGASLLGKGVLPLSFLQRPVILIGAGTGIAPLLAVLKQPSSHFRWLISGQRTVAEAIAPLQWAGASQRHQDAARWRYDGCVTRESVLLPYSDSKDGLVMTLHQGRVPLFLQSEAASLVDMLRSKGAGVFVCGPSAFVQSVRTTMASILHLADGGRAEEDDESLRTHALRMAEAAGDFVVESWSSH